MFDVARSLYVRALEDIRAAGLYKEERILATPQGPVIRTEGGAGVLNFCANNYLGLSSHPAVIAAAKEAIDTHGFGLSSVRFICGTQDLHRRLESRIARFFGTEDAILYSSCFDANGGLFETLLGEEDAVISDALNHASIIDGIRLCKAERHRYPNGDMAALEDILRATAGKRLRLIATDGVFSMDGYLAKLDTICDLADKYRAMVMVDDSHATGFIGPTGRGTAELCGVMHRVDVITSTLGKALGGASGGFTTGRQPIVDLLRQRSRPYLFSNTLAPAIAGASIAVFDLIDAEPSLRARVMENARRFRQGMTQAGFTIKPGIHPIVPIMLGEAQLANEMARALLAEGIYVIGFSYPVVPKGEARIRVQLSAAHEPEHVDQAIDAFLRVGRRLGVVA
ncbi:glycine C-acetyltransferase [Sorangium sp. So ce128]|uniref:glycine C-acetyltransferase n=1 Tax=Sorangium sp. So ce128 TaxID=3133281 RepID=UPI003F5DB92B